MSLNDFMSALDRSSERRQREIKKYLQNLGEPDLIIKDQKPTSLKYYETGFWRLADGVIYMSRVVGADGTRSTWNYDNRQGLSEDVFKAIRLLPKQCRVTKTWGEWKIHFLDNANAKWPHHVIADNSGFNDSDRLSEAQAKEAWAECELEVE